MSINAAYIIRAGNWFDAQRALCSVRGQLYTGPAGNWLIEKRDNDRLIIAVNCEDKNEMTPKDFTAVHDLLTRHIRSPEKEQYQPTQYLPRFMVIDVA